MKSFIFALLMLLSIAIFVIFNSNQTTSHIDKMLTLAEKLPKTKKDFENQSENTEIIFRELTGLWKTYFPLISFTAGYENTDRCDEAMIALSVHFENGNGEDFSAAVSEFRDSLARLKILEGLHWQGIL